MYYNTLDNDGCTTIERTKRRGGAIDPPPVFVGLCAPRSLRDPVVVRTCGGTSRAGGKAGAWIHYYAVSTSTCMPGSRSAPEPTPSPRAIHRCALLSAARSIGPARGPHVPRDRDGHFSACFLRFPPVNVLLARAGAVAVAVAADLPIDRRRLRLTARARAGGDFQWPPCTRQGE